MSKKQKDLEVLEDLNFTEIHEQLNKLVRIEYTPNETEPYYPVNDSENNLKYSNISLWTSKG
jgi:UDP-galactopyranose mutase